MCVFVWGGGAHVVGGWVGGRAGVHAPPISPLPTHPLPLTEFHLLFFLLRSEALVRV